MSNYVNSENFKIDKKYLPGTAQPVSLSLMVASPFANSNYSIGHELLRQKTKFHENLH